MATADFSTTCHQCQLKHWVFYIYYVTIKYFKDFILVPSVCRLSVNRSANDLTNGFQICKHLYIHTYVPYLKSTTCFD